MKGSMSSKRRKVLENKRMLLFEELLAEAEFLDTHLVKDICNGFALTGKLPPSFHFESRYKPANMATESLRSIAD